MSACGFFTAVSYTGAQYTSHTSEARNGTLSEINYNFYPNEVLQYYYYNVSLIALRNQNKADPRRGKKASSIQYDYRK